MKGPNPQVPPVKFGEGGMKCPHRDITNKKCIDHCHNKEKIRGVLCNNCNTALGLVGDNVEILSKLIQYLEQSEQQELLLH